MPLLDALREHWCCSTYMTGFSSSKADAETDKQFSPQLVAGIIHDPMFKGYNYLVMAVGLIMRRLSSWLEACPCHVKHVREAGKWRKAPVVWRAIFPEMGYSPHCLVAGCRAPELATGAIEDMLGVVSDYCCADMVRQLPEGLSSQQRTMLIDDFGMARSYFMLGLRLKLDCWRRLPLCLAGLAHHAPEKRQVAAAHSLREFDQSLADGFQLQMHHPLSLKFLHAESLLRPYVEQIAAGHGVAEPARLEISKFKFIPVVERTQ